MSLPAEMVGDILERLPVKSLMRFKSVDPSWDSLIKTNSFISKHSQRQIQMQKEEWGSNEERFMMYYIDKMSSKHCITLLSCYKPPTPFHIENVELEYPSIHHPGYYLASTCIYGHCNGVICLAAALRNAENEFIEDTIVWNPATREVKLLPPLTHHAPLAYSDHIFIEEFAFGAAHGDTFNDFKFIQFYTDEYPDININTVVFAKVYNVNSNSWTIINDVHVSDIVNPDTPLDRVCFVGEIVFANGVCHWLSTHYTYILCFDFSCNRFRKLNTPSTNMSSCRARILQTRDSIAFAVLHTGDNNLPYNRVEIWILNQDSSSWAKLFNIELLDPLIKIYAILKDGAEFLGRYGYHGHNLKSYDSNGRLMRQYEFSNADGQIHVDMHEYVESIATLS